MKPKVILFPALSLAAALHLATARAQVAPAPTNAPPWTGSVAAGLSLTRGNSRTLLGTVNFNAQRKWSTEEILLGADGTYGENDDTKNAESLHGFGQYNHLVTERFYYGAKLDALTDPISDINYRLSLAPLVGYYFIKQTNCTLAGEVGPAVVLQKLGPTTRGFATLRVAERFEYKFSERARVWQSVEIFPQVDYFKNYYVNAEAGVESALTKKTSLRVFVQDTYYNIPATGRLKNDFKLVSAIAYKF